MTVTELYHLLLELQLEFPDDRQRESDDDQVKAKTGSCDKCQVANLARRAL